VHVRARGIRVCVCVCLVHGHARFLLAFYRRPRRLSDPKTPEILGGRCDSKFPRKFNHPSLRGIANETAASRCTLLHAPDPLSRSFIEAYLSSRRAVPRTFGTRERSREAQSLIAAFPKGESPEVESPLGSPNVAQSRPLLNASSNY